MGSNQRNIDDFDDYIIPSNFFDIPKSFTLIELPICENIKIKSKQFLKRFHRFTKNRSEVAIKGGLSGLRQFLAAESPLKMMKNVFYFTSKALFVLKIFKFLS